LVIGGAFGPHSKNQWMHKCFQIIIQKPFLSCSKKNREKKKEPNKKRKSENVLVHNCFKYFCSKIEPNNYFSVVPKNREKKKIQKCFG